MITFENLLYAVRNLLSRKVRSFLTILSIFVGITTIFIFISFGWGLYHYIDKISMQMGVDKIIVQAKGIGAPGLDQSFKLLDKDLNVLSKTRGISYSIGVAVNSVKIVKDRKISYQMAISVPTSRKSDIDFFLEYLTVKISQGRMIEKGDLLKAVLGSNYRRDNKIFTKGYKVGDKATINGRELEVIGFFEEIGNPNDDANIYLSEDAYKVLTNETDISYAMLVGRVENIDSMKETIDRVTKRLRSSRNEKEGKEDFFVSSSEDLIASFKSVLNIVIGFIVLIALISVLVSAVNTSNTMFTSILERTREIGILKAIGARNSGILRIFLLESGLLGLLAGCVGVGLGYVLSSIGGAVLKGLGWGFLQPYSPPSLFIGCILFATLVGTISGAIPAYRASRKNPVDSLRYE